MKPFPLMGTVSHGTFRNQDLIPTFAEAFQDILTWYNQLDEYASEYASEYTSEYAPWLELDDDDPEWDTKEAFDLVNELHDQLNELAPPYCYFGNTEGDGSDFGFWPSVDDLLEDTEVLKVSDMSKVPPGHNDLVALVNDHGNVTLYRPRIVYDEVWSVV